MTKKTDKTDKKLDSKIVETPGIAEPSHFSSPTVELQTETKVQNEIPIIQSSTFRPSPSAPNPESGSVIVAKLLAAQLGSDPIHLAQMLIDERKTAVLNDKTASATGYFVFRGTVDGIRFWNFMSNWELVSSQSIDGLARRHILQAIAASSGIQSMETAQRPNVISRNLTNRNWKEKAEKEGKIVNE